MSLFQKLVAPMLYAGHSGTVVSIIVLVFSELTLLCLKIYTRLQKLSISISKNAMYSLLICLGNGHDSTVKK